MSCATTATTRGRSGLRVKAREGACSAAVRSAARFPYVAGGAGTVIADERAHGYTQSRITHQKQHEIALAKQHQVTLEELQVTRPRELGTALR